MATYSLVQAKGTNTGRSGAWSISGLAAPSAGNLLVIVVGANVNTLPTVTSPGTYGAALSSVVGASSGALGVYAKIAGVGEPTTVSGGGSNSGGIVATFLEYSPNGGTIGTAVSATAAAVSGATLTTPAVTTSAGQAGMYIGAAAVHSSSASPFSSWGVGGTSVGAADDTEQHSSFAIGTNIWHLDVTSTLGTAVTGTVTSSASTSEYATLVFYPITSSGTLNTLPLSGALSSSGGSVRNPNKSASAALGASGAVVKRNVARQLSAALNSTGAATKYLAKTALSATTSFAGSITPSRLYVKALTAASGFVGSKGSSISKFTSGSLTSSGSNIKTTAHTLKATFTPAGSTLKRIQRTLAGALSSVGSAVSSVISLPQAYTKALTAALNLSGAALKQANKALSGGTITLIPAVSSDYETNVVGDWPTSWWNGNSGSPPAITTFAIYSTWSYSGTKSLHFVTGSHSGTTQVDYIAWSQTTGIVSGQSYTFTQHLHVNSLPNTYNVTLQVDWFTSGGAWLASSVGNTLTVDGLLTLTASAPATAGRCNILTMVTSGTGVADIAIDLTQMTAAGGGLPSLGATGGFATVLSNRALNFFAHLGMSSSAGVGANYDSTIASDFPVLYVKGDTIDHGSGGHSISLHGAPTTTPLPNGDNAWAFDSSGTQWLTVADADDLSVSTTGVLTVECWMRPDALHQPNSIGDGFVNFLGKASYWTPPGANQYEWEFRMYNNDTTNTSNAALAVCGYLFNLSGGIGLGWDDSAGHTVGEWVHYVVIYQMAGGGFIKIFRNGAQVNDEQPLSGITPANGTAPLTIGANETGEATFSKWYGGIGKVAIYSHELTPAEINSHYQAMSTPSGQSYLLRQTQKAYSASISSAGKVVRRNVVHLISAAWSGAPAMAKNLTRTLPAAALSTSASIIKQPSKVFNAVISSSGSTLRGVGRFFNAALSSTGSTVNAMRHSLSGALNAGGASTKSASHSLTATLNATGSATKSVWKTLAAALGSAGSVVAEFVGAIFAQTFTAALNAAGATTNQTKKTLAAAQNLQGTLSRALSRLLTASVAFAGGATSSTAQTFSAALNAAGNWASTIISGLHQYYETFTGDLGLSGSANALQQVLTYITDKIYVVGNNIRQTSAVNQLSGAIIASGEMIRGAEFSTIFRAALASVGKVFKQGNSTINAALTSTGNALKLANRVVKASLTSSASAVKQSAHTAKATLTGAGSAPRKTAKAITATLSSSGKVKATFLLHIIFNGALSAAGAVSNRTRKLLVAAQGLHGSASRLTSRLLKASVTPRGSMIKRTLQGIGAVLSASFSATGTVINRTSHTLQGALVSSGAVLNQITHTFHASVAARDVIAKQITRTFAGTLPSEGMIITGRFIRQALNAALSAAGTVTTKEGRALILEASLAFTGSQAHQVSRLIQAVLAPVSKTTKSLTKTAFMASQDFAAQAKRQAQSFFQAAFSTQGEFGDLPHKRFRARLRFLAKIFFKLSSQVRNRAFAWDNQTYTATVTDEPTYTAYVYDSAFSR